MTRIVEPDACAIGGVYAPETMAVAPILKALKRMEHRGSGVLDAEGRVSGDGAGVLMRMPRAARQWVRERRPEVSLADEPFENLGVGVFFLPRDAVQAEMLEKRAVEVLEHQGLTVLCWRTVPLDVRAAGLGVRARENRPRIRHLLLARPPGMDGDTFEGRLFQARKRIEKIFPDETTHIPSLSSRVLNYKGMLTGEQFATFYRDFHDEANPLNSRCYVFHRRFSTNTYPHWPLAQPFRLLAHNGEINSIAANRDAVRNIEGRIKDDPGVTDILMPGGSDSADLDRVAEQFHRQGESLTLTLAMMIPPAWRTDAGSPDPEIVRYYRLQKFRHGTLGQWEGPSGVLATDGRVLVAKEDRIGLRPLRWTRLRNGTVFIASEVGAFQPTPEEIETTGKLGSGQLLQVDGRGRLSFDSDALRENLAGREPLRAAMDRLRIIDPPKTPPSPPVVDEQRVERDNICSGFTRQHQRAIEILMGTGNEPTVAMGKSRPAAALSKNPTAVYDFFLQEFAQITNPPVDFIREKKFFDLNTLLGDRTSDQALALTSPALGVAEIHWLEQRPETMRIAIGFPKGNDGREAAHNCRQKLAEILRRIQEGIAGGAALFILHDDALPDGHWPLPGPLLCAWLHHRLIEKHLRQRISLILKCRDMRQPHDLAVNIAFGANALFPKQIWDNAFLLEKKNRDAAAPLAVETLRANLQSGLDKALLKIMSKMGVTTTAGYRDSQLFMPFGLGADILGILGVADVYGLGGRNLAELLEFYDCRKKAGELKEPTFWNPVRKRIEQAAADGDPRPLALIEEERGEPFKILHLLDFRYPPSGARTVLESPEEIVARYFVGAAMSHGALKDEAHRAVAAAFNDLGGRGNSGEGGESKDRDRSRFASQIRQVASGRFGVEARYLVHAREIQIKIAQGAKPGEGGQLLGVKVDEVIARNRHCAPGTTLISPQTHQDIYSIEDLKQLIHDLKSINPTALVSVKIAARYGVGVISVGAAKMFADIIEIDGLDGGTAATPESSREHAAHYAETGLAEVHQALLRHGLRRFVKLRVASSIKSGADVVKYAALGADEFSLGTTLMVAMGCIACAQCHTGDCPETISGLPKKERQPPPTLEERIQRIKNYLLALAADAARITGALGLERLHQLTGRTDLLRVKPADGAAHLRRLNLDFLLKRVAEPPQTPLPNGKTPFEICKRQEVTQGRNREVLDQLLPVIRQGESTRLEIRLDNFDLSFGAMIAGEMVRCWPDGYPEGETIAIIARGYGGQKLGFGCVAGLAITLEGLTNDAPGSAMSGGRLTLIPPRGLRDADRQVMAGNTVGYGAIGGEIDIPGFVGERCAIRNSGCRIVVNGANDFLSEYQTGGETICLSVPGREVGAGMTGGRTIFYNPGGADVSQRISASVRPVDPTPVEIDRLKIRLRHHQRRTGSPLAATILEKWPHSRNDFVFLAPVSK